MEVVLDASALLSLLNQEPGSETIALILPNATISRAASAKFALLMVAGIPAELVNEILDNLAFSLEGRLL